MNWRGARLCAGETYFDSPYYEQLQYMGDTRIQALISLYMTGDDRLVRQAIDALRCLAHPGRDHRQSLSVGSGAVHPDLLADLGRDGARLLDAPRRRPRTCAALLPGIRSVLGWFEGRIDELAARSHALVAISWTGRKGGTGDPPGAKEGHSTVITLQFAYALSERPSWRACRPAGALRTHRSLGQKVRDAVRRRAWDTARAGCSRQTGGDTYSQQANTHGAFSRTPLRPRSRRR